jgi:tetratricopeptide (TPR) repeat protein
MTRTAAPIRASRLRFVRDAIGRASELIVFRSLYFTIVDNLLRDRSILCKSQFVTLCLLWICSLANAQSPTPADAIALEQQGRLAEAEKAWTLIVQQNPRDAAALASLGVVLSKQEKYSDAAVAYRKALALNPKLPGIRLNLGLAEFKQGHFQAAIPPLSSVLAADPSNMQARTLLGLSYYGAKQYAQAAKYLAVAAKADPANAELHKVLAQSCLWTKQYECALTEFRQIIRQNPDSSAAHILAAEALDAMDRRNEAIAEFQQAIKSSPIPPDAHFGLGYLYWKSHRYDEARREFEAELAADPRHAQSLAYLGDIEIKQKNPEKALTFLQKAVAIQNDIHIAHVDIGIILMDQKKYRDAEAAFRRAVEVDPAKADAHYRLARLYQAIGNNSAAQKEFETVRQLNAKEEEGVASKMPGTQR